MLVFYMTDKVFIYKQCTIAVVYVVPVLDTEPS